MNYSNYIFYFILNHFVYVRVSQQWVPISPHIFAIYIIMPLSATVCSSPAFEGACPRGAGGEPGKTYTYRFHPCRRVVGFQLVPCAVPCSAVTLCGTLIFGWHPVSAHWSPMLDLTSKELACNHIAWITSRLTLQGARTHLGQPRRVVSD